MKRTSIVGMDTFTTELIEEWIDEDRVSEWELTHDTDHGFTYRIKLHHIPVVMWVESYGPSLKIETEVGVDPAVLANLLEREQAFAQFRTELMVVLTQVRGIYAFLDDERNTTDLENMRTILLRYAMYPDGASQHLFMESMYALASANLYLNSRPEDIVEPFEERT